jgi:hypothetical protein
MAIRLEIVLIFAANIQFLFISKNPGRRGEDAKIAPYTLMSPMLWR